MSEDAKRQFVEYNFYAANPSWSCLPDKERQEGKEQFIAVAEELASQMLLRS